MKKLFGVVFCVLIAGLVYAQEDEIVPITSFEDAAATPFSGGQVTASFIDQESPDDNVEPYDGEWHCALDYDTSLGAYSWADLDFVEPVDLTGMRLLHVWVYYTEDAQPNSADPPMWELRARLNGAIDLAMGYKSYPADDSSQGQWLEYIWEIDRYSSQNELSEVTGLDMSFMPGADSAQGFCYIDNIYASRPADFPDEHELVTIYSLDEEGVDAAPVGWESLNGDVFIGLGDVEPTEGDNYMEIYNAGGWEQIAITSDAKGASDLWSEATDIYMDVRIGDSFDGDWLLMNPVFQSGGEDADGNPLEPVNGWDSYGERDIRWSGHLGEWKTIAWPFRHDQHLGALENDNGWFQMILVTNNDAAQEGNPIYIDNIRLAIPAETSVQNWSIF